VNPAPDAGPRPGAEDTDLNPQALLEFLHLAPVGLLRMRTDGHILMMNPAAAQLLGHLGYGTGEPNLLRLLDPVTPDLRTLLHLFQGNAGTVFEHYRVALPAADDARRPLALGFTALMLPSDPGSLMVVVADESNAVRLERLRHGWQR
jgi:nitrogen-specific signal transduction histidine kinase